MTAKEWVDDAIDGYRGESLEMVLIGYELWPEFLQQASLSESTETNSDKFVEYRGLVCRPSMAPNDIKLVIMH